MDLSPSSLGRTGGLVVLVFGCALLVAAALLASGVAPAGVDRFGIIPVGTFAFGAVLVAAGWIAIGSAAPRVREQMTKAAARAKLSSEPLPFWVCVACHAVEGGRSTGCRKCGSVVDHVQVDEERDRATAIAALGR
jgi:ribosomal protein L40E